MVESSSHGRAKFAALLTVLVLSAATMVWLFWHFPIITGVATLAILGVLGISAHLARMTDSELVDIVELQRRNQGV
jgi:hypothetical protein